MSYEIIRLGHQGDGVAQGDNGPIFAPLTLPGETVDGTLSGDRLIAPRILTPSADRVSPPCRHFKSCGGCALQHAHDDFVADWKRAMIKKALDPHGIDTDIRPTVTSSAASRRRATFAARRTKKGVLVGFHTRASDTVIEIPDCKLLHPDLMAAIPTVGLLCQQAGSRKGVMRAAVTQARAGLDVAITGGKPLDAQLRMQLAQLAGQHGMARLTWDGDLIIEAEPPTQSFGAAQVAPPPGSFMQATADGEAALLGAVREILGSNIAKVVDLFSGCGTFTLPIAEQAEVHAVETDAPMLAAMNRGWRHARGLKRVTNEARDLFRRPLLPDELAAYDAAIIDPPRAGAEAQSAALAASELTRIAAVSCNPVTFARDAAILIEGGFTLDWILPVDQFRWSPHVELAAQFTRNR